MSFSHRDTFLTLSGMALLLGGRKLTALSTFSQGVIGLENAWRQQHPDFSGKLSDRWQHAVDFYNKEHQHPVNRRLHRIGVPMIIGGTCALLIGRPLRPLWTLGAMSFIAGWTCNIIGHFYEGNKPAFMSDPLSFIAGPLSDWHYLRSKKMNDIFNKIRPPSSALN